MSKVRIFQINHTKIDLEATTFADTMFRANFGKVTQEDIDNVYALVFEGTMNTCDLEEIFHLCNDKRPVGYYPLGDMYSMSVGDLVEVDGTLYQCDMIGFSKSDFDVSNL